MAVDSGGEVRDGDELIALAATHLVSRGELGGGVAVAVMSNFGFHTAMEKAGIPVATTSVGDRNVSEELRERDWTLGGEQSGHIIWTSFAPTGDGIASALLTCRALGGRSLAEAIPMEKLPQTLVNVRVADRDAIRDARTFWHEVERETEALGTGSRPRAPVGDRAAGPHHGRSSYPGSGGRGHGPAFGSRRARARYRLSAASKGQASQDRWAF